MRQTLLIILIPLLLASCGGINQNTTGMPESTNIPIPTIGQDNNPSSAPIVTSNSIFTPTPDSSAKVLTDFPLAVGATWIYSADISYQASNDPSEMNTWTGVITDKIIDKQTLQDGQIVFIVQESMEPPPPTEVWRQPDLFTYTVLGNMVYKNDLKIFEWPIVDEMHWAAFTGLEYEVLVKQTGEVDTLSGIYNDCYNLVLATTPDTTTDTFCQGIGFVKHSYQHHGTRQIENLTLASFSPGE